MMAADLTDRSDLETAMRVIERLSIGIGGRRPTSAEEREAAEILAEILASPDIRARLEPFPGYSSFAWPFAVLMALAATPALMPRRIRKTRIAMALVSAAGLLSEGSLLTSPLSRVLARRESHNVVAEIEPREQHSRTLCLVAHMDSSRSGLIFDPRVACWMPRWIAANSLLVLGAAALEPFSSRVRAVPPILNAARSALMASLAALGERELRGVDVPGANDNASGCGVVVSLAARIVAQPLRSTRVVILITGCEESGTLGARAFRDSRDTSGWMFLNFDSVGGPGCVRFLRREGVIAKWDADPGLVLAATRVSARRPELRMAPEDSPAGLTYDTSPIHAAGGRALTISVQDGFIPDLHWPTDVFENVDPDGVRRTLEAGAELIAAIDRGDAD